MKPSTLFSPFKCKSLTLPNRFVMAPMTRSLSPNGIPTEDVAQYYARRANGGVGLILTEGTGINRPGSTNHPDIPVFYGDEALSGWKNVVQKTHEQGGKIAPQLWHVGASAGKVGYPDLKDLESPSGILNADTAQGRPMSEEDIADTISAFAQAAVNAKKLGFDCIELHGAHGYLIDQFFWSDSNKRTDQYGGDLSARTLFASELVKAVRKAVGEDMALLMRISQWKIPVFDARVVDTAEELEQWVAPLSEAGIDIFDCSTRKFWTPEFTGSDLNLAGWVKKITGKPTITVGSVGLSGAEFIPSLGGAETKPDSLDKLEERLDRGEFDLVAAGRVLISDPNWCNKIKEQRFSDCIGFNPGDLSKLV